jgi:ubiquinone/menaquinone biosynthesis C-methylase UbiE
MKTKKTKRTRVMEEEEEEPDFSSPSYWNAHYGKATDVFEWYQPWPSFKPFLKASVVYHGRALNVGCGTSQMSLQLLKDGFQKVISIDFSEIIINQMTARYAREARLEWRTADCTNLTFANNSIDFAFDKGTFDCLSAAVDAADRISQYLHSIARCIVDDGCLIIISFGPPDTRQRFFKPLEKQLKLVDTIQVPNPGINGAFHYLYVLRKQWSGSL